MLELWLPQLKMLRADLSAATPISVWVEGKDHHKAEIELRVANDVILVLLSLHACTGCCQVCHATYRVIPCYQGRVCGLGLVSCSTVPSEAACILVITLKQHRRFGHGMSEHVAWVPLTGLSAWAGKWMRLLYRVKYLLWATSSCVISKLYSWSLPSSSMQMTSSEK